MIDDLLRAEDPNYKLTPKTEVTSRFYVLPEMIGPAIIGKAGTHAKHIRERTGVRIEVVRESLTAAGGGVGAVGSDGRRAGGLGRHGVGSSMLLVWVCTQWVAAACSDLSISLAGRLMLPSVRKHC